MSSVSPEELEVLKKCIQKISAGHKAAAACIYGSRVAGYSRPGSDIDILIILEQYPYAIKYVYLRESGIDVSALVVSRNSLESDARNASLGEFAVGRLLHIYEPLVNAELIDRIERVYKRRVILEELRNIVDTTGLFSTEILFPLEYVAFSKIKHRISLYPGAVYSYYQTYAASASSKRNLNFALAGYRRALDDIVSEDRALFQQRSDLLQISDKRVFVDRGKIRLSLTKKLQEFSSYFVHTYAGRRIMHLVIKEAESKIRRHAGSVELPQFMGSPRSAFWKLAEGKLIVDSNDWINDLAMSQGIEKYSIAEKRRLGNVNSRTILYVLHHDSGDYKVVAKDVAKTKSVKWAALSIWTMRVKRFKVNPLFRLGSEYKAIRYLRKLGLGTPEIEAVVLDRKVLITRFVEGRTLAAVIKDYIKGSGDLGPLREAGVQIAKIHDAGASLGNIKPKNVIVSDRGLCFTDTEQFIFSSKDQVWDLAQFLSWGLKSTRSGAKAGSIAREFLRGYLDGAASKSNVAMLAKSKRYIQSFYPVLVPSVARALKNELKEILR